MVRTTPWNERTVPGSKYARGYSTAAVLKDGGSILIRAIRPDDKERLLDLLDRMSAQSVYFRFFRTRRRLSDEEIKKYTEVDFDRDVGLVATLSEVGAERIIGVGRYSILDEMPGEPRRAEVAFAVVDAHQGRGIGTLLLEHLAPMARANGVARFEADVLGENNRMLQMFATSGLSVERSFDSGIFHFSFSIEPTKGFLDASLERERTAEARSIRAFLEPRSVAVVGASRRVGTIGGAILSNLKEGGFRGPIYPVNPRASTINELRAYPTVSAIGAPVDLAVIAVPAASVEAVIADCARAGVRGVIVISAGFSEVSREGKESERRLVRLVRGAGMRMVGPNCMGLLNTDSAISLNATFCRSRPPPGNIGMSSQSGALGIAVLDHLQALNIGVSTFVSVGNKADVSSNDLLSYWYDDPRTNVILLYLESFGNPRKFARLAPVVTRRKPIVAVKSGRSAAGTRAASSHSAALASLDVAVDALFDQTGVIRTSTVEELFDVAALLSTQPLPPGPRVGVVTNAGGPGILFADACEARGLKLPELTEASLRALRAFLPPAAALSNPVDMIASAGSDEYERAVEIVGNDDRVDSLVALYIPVLSAGADDVARAIARGAGKVLARKPILSVFLSSHGAPPLLGSGPRGLIPSFTFPENAAMALAAAERYARWRSRPAGTAMSLDRFAAAAARAVVDRLLAGAKGSVWLETDDLAAILRAAGIDFAAGETTRADPAAAASAAERLGYPLVAKAIAPGLLHKSDVGGVVLGLRSAKEVAAAVETLAGRVRAHGSTLEGVFLQREVPGGIEALVGVMTDATLGPIVVCGLGGRLVEILKDVSFHLPPVSDADAIQMIARLRSARLLDGYRGDPPGDRDALTRMIQRVSALVEAVPEIQELDLNPVKVLAPGQGAIAVDGRMRIAPITIENP
jgi:acetyl coenzyme A synthetase (ADP forming)-like protein